jgi:hypothetical protein
MVPMWLAMPASSCGACRFQAALEAAATGEAELLILDAQCLQTQHLSELVDRLGMTGENSATSALSLEDNFLTDESCLLLRNALKDSTFCPSLISINLTNNQKISALGHAHLKEAILERPDLKVLPFR